MRWNDHDHHAEYADAGHRHYDLERDDEAAQRDAELDDARSGGRAGGVGLQRRGPDPEDSDPDLEADGKGGMSEYRYMILPEGPS